MRNIHICTTLWFNLCFFVALLPWRGMTAAAPFCRHCLACCCYCCCRVESSAYAAASFCIRTCSYALLLLLFTFCRAICSLSNIFWHSAHNCNLFSSLTLSVLLRCCSSHYYSVLLQAFCCCQHSIYTFVVVVAVIASPRTCKRSC